MARPRFGAAGIKRASREDRTYRDIVHESKLNRDRHEQLCALYGAGRVLCYPRLQLGGDAKLDLKKLDFYVAGDGEWQWLGPKGLFLKVVATRGWYEEVKGAVRSGVGTLKRRYAQYGPSGVPLIILTGDSGTGLQTSWTREVVWREESDNA